MKRRAAYIVDTFTSLPAAIALLAALCAAAAFGALLPQGLRGAEYAARYGEGFASVIVRGGLRDVYHSWWFGLLLGAVGLQIVACSLSRLMRRAWTWGFLLTHASLVVVLVGALVSALFSVRGTMGLAEGEAAEAFQTEGGSRPLGFAVALDAFDVEWNQGTPHEVAVWVRDAGILAELPVSVGQTYPIEGSPYTLRIVRALPHFSIDAKGRIGTRGEAPTNPALLVRINSGEDEEERWLFANFPSIAHARDENIKLLYRYAAGVKNFRSRLKIFEGATLAAEGTAAVNAPFTHRGYTFYQAQYDPARPHWTGLLVVKDPGKDIMLAGFLLLNVGIALVFVRKPFVRRGDVSS